MGFRVPVVGWIRFLVKDKAVPMIRVSIGICLEILINALAFNLRFMVSASTGDSLNY